MAGLSLVSPDTLRLSLTETGFLDLLQVFTKDYVIQPKQKHQCNQGPLTLLQKLESLGSQGTKLVPRRHIDFIDR